MREKREDPSLGILGIRICSSCLGFCARPCFCCCCVSNMEFLKEAAKLAHEHSKPQGGGGTSSDGGDYDGALPHPHTTIFSQHATTVSHAGVPDGTAEHTKPSKTELYSSAQVFAPTLLQLAFSCLFCTPFVITAWHCCCCCLEFCSPLLLSPLVMRSLVSTSLVSV